MAKQQNENHQTQEQTQYFSLDALYCEEEQWVEEEEGVGEELLIERESNNIKNNSNGRNNPFLLLEQDVFWEDEQLLSLFSKEKQQQTNLCCFEKDSYLLLVRKEAVEWMIKLNAHYGFSTMSAVLAVNYLDRFIISGLHFQKDKPWMIQLVAVTCLSLAAKVEQTQVPLLLDLQVEDTKYVFQAKTIQRMELLVLSNLQWRMNPVTPLSFIDYIIRRLGLKIHLHWEFLRLCESLILSAMANSRFVRYLPSVLATATMLHVIQQVEPSNAIDYQNQLLGVLKITKEKLNDCYQFIVELSNPCFYDLNNSKKRKHQQIPGSPCGVIDAYFNSDSSNDSLAVASSVCSSPQPLFKKSRFPEQKMRLPSLSKVCLQPEISK